MSKKAVLQTSSTLLVISALLAPGCGGGGGGGATNGSSTATPSSTFILTDVKYGRLVDDGSGPRLVSPLTFATIDPVTGIMTPGSLEVIAPGSNVNINQPQSLGLGTDYLPRVVPRNCVFQLEFTEPIDPSSVTGDKVVNGTLIPGSVQVRSQDNTKAILCNVTLVNSTTIWINPTTATAIGFPASPVDFGPDGEPRADKLGAFALRLPRTGAAVLRTLGNRSLGARADHLGDTSLTNQIGFNPGNAVLDFIAQDSPGATSETYNGFLPDKHPPRIVRNHKYEKVLSFANNDGGGATFVTDATASFSTTAKNGAGEWSRSRLTLRPGQATEEVHTVSTNTSQTVTIFGSFTLAPQDGDTYRLERSEFFEPSLNDPLDPTQFDPENPENGNNTELANFVEAWEISGVDNTNGQSQLVNGATALSVRDTLPSFSELHVHFSEPMAVESFKHWETFRVAFNPDTLDNGGNTKELLTDITLDPTQTIATIRPVRQDQLSIKTTKKPSWEVVGWGKSVKNLQLIITTVPKVSYVANFLADVSTFTDQGWRGVTDLGGQPLAFPESFFDPNDPPVRYSVAFTTSEAASTQVPAPTVSSWGVMVHRMRGRPFTGQDPATALPGVFYRDARNPNEDPANPNDDYLAYRPIPDVNLAANGYLAGSPVVFVTKIHDDYFPPPFGQFGKFPLGVPEPLMSYNTATGPQPHDGARFQLIYRDIDCSPSRDALAGSLLDLYRASWAPIGGNVTSDVYNSISIRASHSSLRPQTTQNSAASQYPYSGLGQPFDFDGWRSLVDPNIADTCPGSCSLNTGPNYYTTKDVTKDQNGNPIDTNPLVLCVPNTQYKVSQTNLFAPPFDGNAYHPWPTFTTAFQYNNGDIPQAESDERNYINSTLNLKCGGSKAWPENRTYNSDPNYDNLGGDSLVLEVRIKPQVTTISRQNGFTFCIGVLLDVYPKFRMFTLGAPGASFNPDGSSQAALCGFHDTVNLINDYNFTLGFGNGDNSRYFAAFDYVKTTSRITSPYMRVSPAATVDPEFKSPIFDPITSIPAFYQSSPPSPAPVTVEYDGAINTKGGTDTGFVTDISKVNFKGKQNLAFRVTFVGSTQTLLLPNFDTVAIPYKRPSGN